VTFEIEVNGRTRAVSVERLKHDGGAGVPDARLVRGGVAAGVAFRVIVDGTPHLVDAVRVDGGALSFIQLDGGHSVGLMGGGRSHRVAITEGASGELTLALADGVVRATVNGRRSRRGGEVAGAAGEQRILAPMPGKVLRVLVQPGQDVAARQPLVVVEAMKMENELSSPRAGRVKEVTAVEGQSVEAGRILIVVE
jgi:biotin carboxyl carrier protein